MTTSPQPPLNVRCPYCLAGRGRSCIVNGAATLRTTTKPHYARIVKSKRIRRHRKPFNTIPTTPPAQSASPKPLLDIAQSLEERAAGRKLQGLPALVDGFTTDLLKAAQVLRLHQEAVILAVDAALSEVRRQGGPEYILTEARGAGLAEARALLVRHDILKVGTL